jgi:hypothetical protein
MLEAHLYSMIVEIVSQKKQKKMNIFVKACSVCFPSTTTATTQKDVPTKLESTNQIS